MMCFIYKRRKWRSRSLLFQWNYRVKSKKEKKRNSVPSDPPVWNCTLWQNLIPEVGTCKHASYTYTLVLYTLTFFLVHICWEDNAHPYHILLRYQTYLRVLLSTGNYIYMQHKTAVKKNLTESSMTNEIRSYVHLSRNTVNRSEIFIPSFSIIWLVLEINEQGRIMKEDLNQEVHRKLGKQKHGLNRHEHAKAFPLRKKKWNTGA